MSRDVLHTGGGSVVGGDVEVASGDFVGRDKVIIYQIIANARWQDEPFTLDRAPDLSRLRSDYLAYLRQSYQYLDFKGVPDLAEAARRLRLDAVYVPLQARPEIPA